MSRQILARTETVIGAIGRIFGIIGIAILAVMMFLTVADVFMRYVLNRPIIGTTEVTEFMMVTLSFLVIVWCTVSRTHIKVDLLAGRISPSARTISDGIFFLFGLGLFSFISWQNFLQAGEMQRTGQSSTVLDIPFHPFYLIVAITCGAVALVLLINLVQSIVQVAKRWT